jgi:MerR family transcriptional regulator, copper efflux regulator
MNIHELTALTGETPRQVRYLVAERLIPPPEGGRSNASYSEMHVAAIHDPQRLRAFGFKPAAIRLLRKGRGGPVTLPIAPGLALRLDPVLLTGAGGGYPDPLTLAARITDLLTDLRKTPQHGADDELAQVRTDDAEDSSIAVPPGERSADHLPISKRSETEVHERRPPAASDCCANLRGRIDWAATLEGLRRHDRGPGDGSRRHAQLRCRGG